MRSETWLFLAQLHFWVVEKILPGSREVFLLAEDIARASKEFFSRLFPRDTQSSYELVQSKRRKARIVEQYLLSYTIASAVPEVSIRIINYTITPPFTEFQSILTS